jgi:hypothetical protein
VQCPKCGAFNPDAFAACGICGVSLRETTPVEPAEVMRSDPAPAQVQLAEPETPEVRPQESVAAEIPQPRIILPEPLDVAETPPPVTQQTSSDTQIVPVATSSWVDAAPEPAVEPSKPESNDWSFETRPVGNGPKHSAAASFDAVANGQKLILYAILVNMVVLLLVGVTGNRAGILLPVLTLGTAIVGIIGLLRVSSGLGFSQASRALLIIATFVPVVGFVMLVIVNARATRALKDAGYRVGLLGAR